MAQHSFEALGTHFALEVSGDGTERIALLHACEQEAHHFDARYSRFKSDSIISVLRKKTGTYEVPRELVAMLRRYQSLNTATKGAINPFIGESLEESGYDSIYSLLSKKPTHKTPLFSETVTIEDDTHITLHQKALIDLGALGKGFLVDVLYEKLVTVGAQGVFVDGSGDMRLAPGATSRTIGLENPFTEGEVVGTLTLTEGALCGSGISRRAWGDRNHYLHPHTNESVHNIVATWVTAKEAALADGLSSALFFTDARQLEDFSFEYALITSEGDIKKSPGFPGEFFS